MEAEFPDSDFLREVRAAFAPLLSEGGLAIESSLYSAESFGSAVVELSGKNVLVRLVRDRGEVVAEASASSKPAQWWPFEWVLRAAGVREASKSSGRVEETARLFAQHRGELEDCFSVANRKGTLERLQAFNEQAAQGSRRRLEPG
jgi:hypothetical protein